MKKGIWVIVIIVVAGLLLAAIRINRDRKTIDNLKNELNQSRIIGSQLKKERDSIQFRFDSCKVVHLPPPVVKNGRYTSKQMDEIDNRLAEILRMQRLNVNPPKTQEPAAEQ